MTLIIDMSTQFRAAGETGVGGSASVHSSICCTCYWSRKALAASCIIATGALGRR